MSAILYLKACWLYMIGVVGVIIGLYLFFTIGIFDNNVMLNAFSVMFFGFAVSVVGSIHGKRVMRNPKFRNALKMKSEEREEKKEKVSEKGEIAEKEEEILDEMPSEPSAPATQQAGKGVVKVIICQNCGEENKYTAVFCDKCGKHLRPKKM